MTPIDPKATRMTRRAAIVVGTTGAVVIAGILALAVALSTGGDDGRGQSSGPSTSAASTSTAPATTTAPPLFTGAPTSTTAPTPRPTTTAPVATTSPRPTSVPLTPEHPVLALGSRGTALATLQQRLAGLGISPGTIGGTFDRSTARAVVTFQRAVGLPQTGIVDAATWAALDAAKPPFETGTATTPTTTTPTTTTPTTTTPTTTTTTATQTTTTATPTTAKTTPPATTSKRTAARLQRRLLASEALSHSNRGLPDDQRFHVSYTPGKSLVVTWAINDGREPLDSVPSACHRNATTTTTGQTGTEPTTTKSSTTTTAATTMTTTTAATTTSTTAGAQVPVDPATLPTRDRARFEANEILDRLDSGISTLSIKRVRLIGTYSTAGTADARVVDVTYLKPVALSHHFDASVVFDRPPADKVGCLAEAFR
jgi:peptidoglycan hydrolase-like protein with peptidoglycan-binding domain